MKRNEQGHEVTSLAAIERRERREFIIGGGIAATALAATLLLNGGSNQNADPSTIPGTCEEGDWTITTEDVFNVRTSPVVSNNLLGTVEEQGGEVIHTGTICRKTEYHNGEWIGVPSNSIDNEGEIRLGDDADNIVWINQGEGIRSIVAVEPLAATSE